MKKLLAMALCLVAVSGYAQKGKEKIAADFYGVDYSCVDVKGADEEPGAFIKAVSYTHLTLPTTPYV